MGYADDWPKPRGRNGYLTGDEIERVRQAFISRRKLRDIARDLGCASRTISKYYGFFRAEGVRQEPR